MVAAQDTTEMMIMMMPDVVLPLDCVVGVNGAPMGLMAKVVDVCLAVDPDGIADNAEPDDEALPDGCVN